VKNPKTETLCNLLILDKHVRNRVARWFIFKPKIPIRVNFEGPLNEKKYIHSMAIGVYYG
jgi:hypothetical protein